MEYLAWTEFGCIGADMHFPGLNLSKVNIAAKTNPAYLPKYHWKPEPADPRDYIWQPPAGMPLTLATKVDLRANCSPIYDQGQLGSCTGNAIAGALELVERKNYKGTTYATYVFSRLFIYYLERVLEGSVNSDAGAYIRDGFKAVNQTGACLESYWPYVISKFAVKPPTTAYTNAAKQKVVTYASLANLTGIKTAVAAGYPVVLGFLVYASFESAATAKTGLMPYPNTKTETFYGGHAICVVGYDDTLAVPGKNPGRLICRNSWGTGWGDKGYFYMPYGIITDGMASDFWTLSAITNQK
jgi:C1A family cysteine protease